MSSVFSEEEIVNGFMVEICPPKGGRQAGMTAKDLEFKMRHALRLIRTNLYFSGALEILEKHEKELEGFRVELQAARNKDSLVPLLVPVAKASLDDKAGKKAEMAANRDLGTLRGSVGAAKEVFHDITYHLGAYSAWGGGIDAAPRGKVFNKEDLENLRIVALGDAGRFVRTEVERSALDGAAEKAQPSGPNARRRI